METITDLMCNEHIRIYHMLNELDEHKDKKDIMHFFDIFKWNLEKHFFVEEKAIVALYKDITGEEINDFFDVMKEHQEIMKLVRQVSNNIKSSLKIDVDELKQSLDVHARFENEVFYPKLDEKLNQLQKNFIIERAKEVIRG